jgi:hypothetical protein
MPWTVKDVDRHKKGLTPSQKKKWVSIANAVLRTCKAKGGKDCEGKAIRIANSKFNDKEIKMAREIPQGATMFLDEGHGCQAFVEFGEGDQKPKIKMVAYSGKIIKNHWYWGDLAIDLSGMKFPKSKYPILEEHWNDKKIGFTSKPIVNEDGELVLPDNAELVDTPASQEFQKLSKQGFPYQSSIRAKPINVERLEDGAKAEVNGFTLKGPGTIWRECIFKEASVCLFGADDKTKSQAFGDPIEIEFSESTITAGTGVDNKPKLAIRKEVKKSMNLAELKEQHPELVAEITEEVTKPLVDAHKAEVDGLKDQLAVKTQATEELSGKVLKLEKKDALRSEAEMKSEADKIWMEKLSKSAIPDRLFDKVMAQIKHDSYVKDEVLDVAAFSEAIDAEIKDWEEKVPGETVQGSAFTEKSVNSTENSPDAAKLAEENKSISERLLSHVGQTPKKEE